MGRLERLNPFHRVGDPPPPRVRDAVNKVLEIGDEVVVITPKWLMRVAEIKPLLDPGAPPNAMSVVLVTRVMLVAPRDGRIEDLYVTRHQAEIGDHAISLTPESQGPKEPQ